uniref:C-type lectin domain-containing protein n=1 Tax=Sparus aurata TaxID=8175 RepID=A0A671UWK1_SPAAU
ALIHRKPTWTSLGQIICLHNERIIFFIVQADQLQSSYETLTAEREQLEARLTNLTTEKDQLQQSYNSLTTDRDQLNATLNNVTTEKDRLKAIYDTLSRGSDQLKTSYNNIQRDLESLQTNHNNLTKSRDKLQARYSTLQREKDELQTIFHELQRSYDTLWKEKERFKTNELQKTVDKVKREMFLEFLFILACKTGWQKFDIGCYFVSTWKKNWTLSRQECIDMGADLVVIDSRDEQAFVKGMLKSGQNAWIGLTDSLTEGTWMWVDGTPVTTTYWQPGQPNSFNGNQDCGEILHRSAGVGEWNDDGCFAEQYWICEN